MTLARHLRLHEDLANGDKGDGIDGAARSK
jgi:hypothetical protein